MHRLAKGEMGMGMAFDIVVGKLRPTLLGGRINKATILSFSNISSQPEELYRICLLTSLSYLPGIDNSNSSCGLGGFNRDGLPPSHPDVVGSGVA